jgi:hypothetical protein
MKTFSSAQANSGYAHNPTQPVIRSSDSQWTAMSNIFPGKLSLAIHSSQQTTRRHYEGLAPAVSAALTHSSHQTLPAALSL